jgi:hypothetical protein
MLCIRTTFRILNLPYEVRGECAGSTSAEGNRFIAKTPRFGPVPAFSWGRRQLEMLFLILLFVLLLAVLPTWPYSSGWGFYPSGGLGVILLVVLVLVLMGRI